MTATVVWRPERLTARLVAAARPAAVEVGKAVAARAPANEIRRTVRVAGAGTSFSVGSTSPLGSFFEKGTKPHTIEPKGRVLRLQDGRFVTGSVKHPGMKAQPWLRPGLALWPRFYRAIASRFVRGI